MDLVVVPLRFEAEHDHCLGSEKKTLSFRSTGCVLERDSHTIRPNQGSDNPEPIINQLSFT